MKKLLLLTFILICGFTAFGQAPTETPKLKAKTDWDLQQQAKKFKFSNRYSVSYDKFEDHTIVRCMGFNMIGLGESTAEIMSKGLGGYGRSPLASTIYFGAGFMFKGNMLKEDAANYFLYFNYTGEEWKFLKNSKFIALLDGEKRIQFGEGEAARDVGRRDVTELIGFQVTKEQLQEMAAAKTIEIKIGNYAKPLKAESQEMFANIIKLGTLTPLEAISK